MSDYIGRFGSVALFLVSGQIRSIRASARGCNRGTERVVVASHHVLALALARASG
jgi:hypothetical protein